MLRQLDDHREYLAALAAACSRNPQVHAHQLAALAVERERCATAATIGDYLAASNGGFELTRAAQLDRLAGHARVAALVDDRWAAQAALAEYRAAVGADDATGWIDALTRGAVAATEARRRSADGAGQWVRCVGSLVRARAGEADVDDCAADAVGAWQALLAAEPSFDPWQLAARPSLRLRVPWDDRALAALAGWCEHLLPRADAPPPTPAIETVAELERLQAGWTGRLGGPGSVAPAADAPAVDPPLVDYLAALDAAAAHGGPRVRAAVAAAHAAAAPAGGSKRALVALLRGGHFAAVAAAPLRDRAEDALARQSFWPEPWLASHWRALDARLARAGTATEVDLLACHGEACLAVEADWQGLWLTSALLPLRAALLRRVLGPAGAAGVSAASGVATALLGRGPRALLAIPSVDAWLHGALAPHAEPRAEFSSAALGETGSALLGPLRAWHAMGPSRAPSVTPASVGPLLQAALDEAGAAESPAEPGRWIQWWGRQGTPEQCADLQAGPGRPPVPGLP